MKRSIDSGITLAILPLKNMSRDQTIDMFCQGLVMDLITDLSRFRSFQLISYQAVRRMKEEGNPDGHQLQGLELDYKVEGLVRYQNDELLINLQLNNARSNRLVWAERFSGTLEELFRIQEDISRKIVASLQHFMDHDVLGELRKKPLTNLNAYECWLRGYDELKKGTLEADEQARVYFNKAMEIDPYFARAYTGMSLTYFNEWSCQIWERWEVSQKGAFEWAQKALELDEFDHISTAIIGRIYLFDGEYEKAEHYLRKAVELNPSDAEILLQVALGLAYLGYPAEAKSLFEKGKRLNPSGEDSFFAHGAFISLEMGDVDEAIKLGEKYYEGKGWVDFPAFLAAAYYLKGDMDNMRASWDEFMRQFSEKINKGREADRQTALNWMINVNPFKGDTRLKAFWKFMSEGELPEVSFPKKPGSTFTKNSLRSKNGMWTACYEGQEVTLPGLKGLYDLARLLQEPYREVYCTELMDAAVVEKGSQALDDKARKEYQKRIRELQQEIGEAEEFNDLERSARLQQEYEKLLDHLSGSLGVRGRSRKLSGTEEKARSAVTWRIRNAIKRIKEAHPQLGRHLELSVKTGTLCCYSPEKEVNWSIFV